MSNTERKARKRAGIPFHREPKVGTPLEDRRKSQPMFTEDGDPNEHTTPAARARALADAARARRAAKDTTPPAGHVPAAITLARKTG